MLCYSEYFGSNNLFLSSQNDDTLHSRLKTPEKIIQKDDGEKTQIN